MSRADIGTVALPQQVEKRVHIAASLLSAYQINARVRAWDGTRCSLLVTDPADAYGHQVFSLARQRGTPVLIVSDTWEGESDAVATSLHTPASVLAEYLRDLLLAGAVLSYQADPEMSGTASNLPFLCQLAQPELCGRPVDATYGSRVIHIRPDAARIFASSHGDLGYARETLFRVAWELRVVHPTEPHQVRDRVGVSLDAFLLQCAYHARDRLPPFPDGYFLLQDWPDLGSAPDLIDALRVARELLRGPVTAPMIRQRCEVGLDEVEACLWAFKAADLLRRSDEGGAPDVSVPSSPATGLLARVARYFGVTLR